MLVVISHLRKPDRERGSVLVMVALWMSLVAIMLSFGINIGHWFEHKRHLQLQVDAAALAGGDMLGSCFNNGAGDNAIFQEATKYVGASAQFNGNPLTYTPSYNFQVSGSHKGTVSVRYQSKTYADGTNPSDGTETSGPCETSDKMFDVKATESNLPWFFGGNVVPAINAHARVQLHGLHDTNPSLPLAVPDNNPKQVGTTFVNEASGAELTGCSGPNHVAGTGCTFLLTKGSPSGGLNMWSATETVAIPGAPAKIGVRVGMGGQVGTCANTNGSASYSCYDGSSTTAGLTMIRDYAVGSPPPPVAPSNMSPPVLDGVWPTSCSGNGAFFFITTGTCAAGVTAEVNYGTGSTQPPNTYFIRATVGGATANLHPVSYDSARSAWIWSTTGSPFALAPQAGAQGISLAWEVQDTSKNIGGACTTRNNNPCKGNFASAPQQRFYSGINDISGSGPIRSMQVTGGTDPDGPASLVAGAAALTVTVGVAGNYQVHTPCAPPPSGKNYSCAGDPAVLLRLKTNNGNTTYTVDCGSAGGGGPDLYSQITQGCQNKFSINSADVCPDAGPAPNPPDCAPVNNVGSGLKRGQLVKAMNDRFAPGGNCLTNNYPVVTSTDKRVVILMLTDFSAFNNNGAGVTVPVVNYGAFYITGWDSADASCNSQNEPFPGPGTSDTGMIWGHFIAYVDIGGTGGNGACDPSGLLPCVPVLTQ